MKNWGKALFGEGDQIQSDAPLIPHEFTAIRCGSHPPCKEARHHDFLSCFKGYHPKARKNCDMRKSNKVEIK